MFVTIGIMVYEIFMVTTYPEDYLGFVSYIVMIDLMVLALIGITLFQIFNKKKNAPKWAIASLITFGILNLISLQIILVIANIIWIFYFLKSERVKNTFYGGKAISKPIKKKSVKKRAGGFSNFKSDLKRL